MKENLYCLNCGKKLTGKQQKYCSQKCQKEHYRKENADKVKKWTEISHDSYIINKLKLIEYKGGKCEICGYDKNISALEFHHIKDKNFGICEKKISTITDEIIKEVDKCILVCANCHRELHNASLTKENVIKLEQEIIKYKNEQQKKEIEKSYCQICGKQITKGHTLCSKCFGKTNRVIERPSKEELEKLIFTYPMTQVGEMFGVTSNAISRWCVSYGLPSKAREIKAIKNSKPFTDVSNSEEQ